MVSNHGGRQLDTAPATIDCIKPIRDTIGNDLKLIVDGAFGAVIMLLKPSPLAQMRVRLAAPIYMAFPLVGKPGSKNAYPSSKLNWNAR